MLRIRSLPAILLLALAITGCSPGSTSFVRDDVDFSFIRRVAVYPFFNYSQDVHASGRTQSIFMAELLDQGGLVAVEPGQVLSAINELKLGTGAPPTPQQAVLLGEKLNADGIFFGTIEEYGLDSTQRDRVYLITASFNLVETQTGSTIWTAQVHKTGTSLWRKLFGGGSASMYKVSREAVCSALGSLF